MPAYNGTSKGTVVCVPIDAHGHVNAMLSLAGELKSLGYRTIFVTNTVKTPKMFDHELVLLEDDDTENQVVNNEQDAFLKAKLFDQECDGEYLDFNLELAGKGALDDATKIAHMHNFGFWKTFLDKIQDSDVNLERILIELKPDLVLVEHIPARPAIWRLAQDSYARKVAGWSRGLRWVPLASLAPLSLYYFADMMHGLSSEQLVPNPWFGLPTRRKLDISEYRAHSECFKEVLIKSGYAHRFKSLARLISTKNPDTVELIDAKFVEVFLNQSQWLNVFMFPRELSYETDFESKLDKTKWIQADSLVRPTSTSSRSLDQSSELLLSRLESWQKSKSGPQCKVIYVSMGTVVSMDLDVMRRVMQQVFKCLEEQPDWYFAVSLGMKHSEVEARFKEEIIHWQKKESRLIANGWWPQPEIFRRQLADVCVVHGGNNTTCEIFDYSTPPPALVVLPAISDQLDNARRIEELGYGVTLSAGRLLRSNSDTLLLSAVQKSLKLHGSKKQMINSNGPRRDARYCAKIIAAKLEQELSSCTQNDSVITV